MSKGWNLDFSYSYFRQILKALSSNFELLFLSEAPRFVRKNEKPRVILRHDIDISLQRALRMGKIEDEFGIKATYMIMPNAGLYQIEDTASKRAIRQLTHMGHEIGLHLSLNYGLENNNHKTNSLEAEINFNCGKLESIVRSPIRSVSFHRPGVQLLRGPLTVAGRVNAYAKELMDWYLSDSKGCWKKGDPLAILLRPRKTLLQLLIHPVWWGDKHKSPNRRLQEFLDTETQGQSRPHVEAFEA